MRINANEPQSESSSKQLNVKFVKHLCHTTIKMFANRSATKRTTKIPTMEMINLSKHHRRANGNKKQNFGRMDESTVECIVFTIAPWLAWICFFCWFDIFCCLFYGSHTYIGSSFV